eukprot:6144085-Pleurochrysis_carterae.AAC.5
MRGALVCSIRFSGKDGHCLRLFACQKEQQSEGCQTPESPEIKGWPNTASKTKVMRTLIDT